MTISDTQWDEVLWDREEEEREELKPKVEENPDDIYASDEQDPNLPRKRDWVGLDRDRRSAFLIIGALKSEGIL